MKQFENIKQNKLGDPIQCFGVCLLFVFFFSGLEKSNINVSSFSQENCSVKSTKICGDNCCIDSFGYYKWLMKA